jgi:hypothetical protein
LTNILFWRNYLWILDFGFLILDYFVKGRTMAQKEKHSGLVTVYVAQGMLRAMVVRGALETAGIPVILAYESVGQVIGLTVDGLGRVEIRVPLEWEAEARDLLDAQPRTGEVYTIPENDEADD